MDEKEIKRKKEKKKIESEVFDVNVLKTLSYFMNKKIIKSVDFPISKGKEAYVFRASTYREGKYLAVKIYMIETSEFKNMFEYIHGDKRFFGVKKKKKDLIYAWTKKEFRNLKICEKAGVSSPRPIAMRNNVLIMEFIGNDYPAPLLKDVGPTNPEENFNQIIEEMKKMYKNNLIHADLSEYNILVKDKLYLIDFGQGVNLSHPRAEYFLKRDVRNVIRYFSKFGINKTEEEIL
ncbi:MAG: serine protein kinase RIO, partial [Candidatus Micrarchaeia archaeon]